MEKHNFTLTEFENSLKGMIASNEQSYNGRWQYSNNVTRVREYTKEEVEQIINSGSLRAKIELSRNYFNKDGFYRRIILHYATLLKYCGILIPNPGFGKKLSNTSIQKKYYGALNFIENMNLPLLEADWTLRVLRDGTYYGVISQLDKTHFAVLDLPSRYCRTRFKDNLGNNVIEFNVQYFDSLTDADGKEAALAAYPVEITTYYKYWCERKNVADSWCLVPTNVGICFQLFDGLPAFLNVIPATMDYDEAVETERERDLEEIRKIIVQKIPHLTDGGLLFEPQEAEQMHKGAVGMMKGNKNISVLTTYADVEGIVSKTSADTASNNLEKMVQNIYYESGTSGQLFASNSNLSLSTSIKNDMALMMILANQYNIFITSIVNEIYANGNVNFKYSILPVNWYNDIEYIDEAYKLATTGYSFLIPAVALGFSQRDIVNIKDLENEMLNLSQKLIPLESAYNSSGDTTQGAGSGTPGAPSLPTEEKSEKTIQNEESLDNGGSK